MKIAATLAAGMSLLAAAPAVAEPTPVVLFSFQGPAVESERSGAAGAKRRLELSGPKGLKRLSWIERRDNPCQLEIEGRNLDNMGLDQSVERDECGPHTSKKPLLVGYGQDESMVFASGLRVCMDGDGKRVKGIQLRGRIVGLDGRISAAENAPKEERTNCKEWKRWVDCAEGSIASGVVAEFEAGDEPRSMTGMRLLCSAVEARTEQVMAPRLAGAPQVMEAVSGKKGEPVDLLPGGGDRGLDLIHWAERRDRPCVITAEGRDLASRNRRSEQTENRCGKADVESKLNLANASMKHEAANLFITGLRVCIHSDRVKGVEVEGEVPVSREDPEPPPRVTGTDKGWQPNCTLAGLLDAFGGDWVRCPPRQLAVGLRAFFEQGEEPRAVRGMTLICRPYE